MGINVVFIDNRDSFVWNLVDAFSILGVETKVVPNTVTVEEIRSLSPDAIVVSPGPGRPDNSRDIGNCLEVIREFAPKVPILGVCLGHQAINETFGGHTSRAQCGPIHGKTSEVYHKESALFDGVPSPFTGGRYHSLAISALAPPLEVIAETPDGTIMAVKHKDYLTFGVQFHPESVLMEEGLKIIENFISIAQSGHNP
ncbi:anthranilate synthase component 2 [Methanohalophilus levihalophilus]|uniref:anthranilate synthase component II n=1 Tax=Methanohalophilus levihalophilus TaxID=1431282 RepID=UPI001FD9B305|nr:aminodeoxychorismate/anthranilate synthase component II [Methanohalophilus levihalophilus]MBP2031107.1 anthranilate synthase component 2 [Methanohalophilus levihalophilus]